MSQHFISLAQAIEMTTRYRTQKESILSSDFRGKNILSISETFDRDAFDDVLAKPGCVALRIYYSMDVNNIVHAIIVGVNKDNDDMLPGAGDTSSIIEDGKICPPLCGTTSPLNSL